MAQNNTFEGSCIVNAHILWYSISVFYIATTCSQAGLSQGCCSWDSQGTKHLTGCYLPGGQCYCDSGCQTAGDCCNDVPKTPTCTQCEYTFA